jgi:DeoR family transcriptional regulator, aga operon transcriptional repressor
MQELGSISIVERQEMIADFVNRKQRASIAELCEAFGISEATARRDLETLDERGLIRRVHGGAIPTRHTPPEMPILQRSSEELEEKRAIGRVAAELVKDGETIFLGSGSTVLEMARALRGRKSITVLTNSLPVVNELADMPEITLVMLGGVFRPTELSFIGHITEQALSDVLADKVFIGIRAIDEKEGLTNAYLPETMTDRAILKIGSEIIVLADHTKCGRHTTVRLAPLSSVHILVTSKKTSLSFIEKLQHAGLRVIQA